MDMGQCTSSEVPPSQNHMDEGAVEAIANASPLTNGSVKSASSFSKSNQRRFPATWVGTRLSRRRKRRHLSDTFNLLDHSNKNNLVNVNSAPEEELMTLPGISRQLAQNIVEYRNTIGGFRRLEDLAIVSGIGAYKLQVIKKDITIRKYPSVDSLPSCDSVRSGQSMSVRSIRSSSSRVVDINSSSIFELMTVRGMTQEMAANIVHYRTKRGPFKNIAQLTKVRGINNRFLYILSAHVSCGGEVSSQASPIIKDSVSVASYGRSLRNLGHRRTQSEPLQSDGTPISDVEQVTPVPNLKHRFSSEFSADLFELLSLRSSRPYFDNVFNGVHDGAPAIRVASWNLQELSLDKINNLGVLEVICRTILENGFTLLALQEVHNKEVLRKICSELHEGSLRRVREWLGPRGEWCWRMEEEGGGKRLNNPSNAAYIYNAAQGIELTHASFLHVHNNNNIKSNSAFLRKPYLAHFKVRDTELVLANVQIKNRKYSRATIEEVSEEDGESGRNDDDGGAEDGRVSSAAPVSPIVSALTPYVTALKDKLLTEKCDVLLGNFNVPPTDKVFDVLRESCHSSLLSDDVFTDISSDRPKGGAATDNIWLGPNAQKLYTGSWGVVRDGLSHMAIPRGWGWGGYASDHCPVYCDLFIEASSAKIRAIPK